MVAKDRQRGVPNHRSGLYLSVAGVLLVLEGLGFALTAVSSPPGKPASYSALTLFELAFAVAIAAGGLMTLLARRFWFAVVAAVAVVVVAVAYGVTTGSPALASGGVVTALAILVLVISGRTKFRDQG